MAKLAENVVKRLEGMRIKARTEEQARTEILRILEESGVDGMEDEDLDTLMDIVESFADETTRQLVSRMEIKEEDEGDALADEAEEEEEEEAEPVHPEPADEFTDMDRSQLKQFIRDNTLEVKVLKKMSDEEIRDAIRAALVTLPATNTEKPKAEKPERERAMGKRGMKLDPKNYVKDREELNDLKRLFPEDRYEYAWLATNGVTIKHKGNNANRSIVTLENCFKQVDGSVRCTAYILALTKQKELLDEAGIEYKPCWNGAPCVKGLTITELIEMLNGFMDTILTNIRKADKRLGENRQRMEENLEKNGKK